MSKKQINGSVIERQQQEYAMKKAMVAEVEQYELAARKFKAEYEMMDYAMKAYALKPAYQEFAKKVMEEANEAFAKLQENNQIEEETEDAQG